MFSAKEKQELKDLQRDFKYMQQDLANARREISCLRGKHEYQLAYINGLNGGKRGIYCKHCWAKAPDGYIECETKRNTKK